MKRLIAHPDNIEALKKQCFEGGKGLFSFNSVIFVADRSIPKETWTGKYVLPDGRAVTREEIRVASGRFFEWDQNDFRLLLWAGLIKEEMEMKFYLLDDSLFNGLRMPFAGS